MVLPMFVMFCGAVSAPSMGSLHEEQLWRMQVPAGVVSPAPEARVRPALQATGLERTFQTVVTGDDVYRGRPDPEAYLFAAQQLGRPSVRCVVIGNSNQVPRTPCLYAGVPVLHADWML